MTQLLRLSGRDAAAETIILASSSPRRRELLLQAGYVFQVMPPAAAAECGKCSRRGPAELVCELAYRKAEDVRRKVAAGIILACDTVVECGGMVLGKPADRVQAGEMLRTLRGRQHRVYSGVCIWPVPGESAPLPVQDADVNEVLSFLEQPSVRVALTVLTMDPLSDAAIEEYLDSGAWEGKAGGFGYQDRLGWVHIVSGSESNVVGLPLELVAEMLGSLDIGDYRSTLSPASGVQAG